ncbi:MAG TPA: hypothetical protein VKU41_14955 [Polyangiaceae bacterium]|nr:hypothetical protein [Polyangiaceae bacterium]
MLVPAAGPGYPRPVALLACPFCHEMFERGEHRSCPVCGVELVPFQKLPSSDDAAGEDGVPRQPEHEPLPPTHLGRGRGVLVVLSIAGLAAFFMPWVKVTMPDITTYSGFSLARRLGWAWGAGIAWFVLLPTVVTRRTIVQMRGARVAAAFLAAFPGLTVGILLARPPHGSHGVPLRFTFGAGLYATLAISVAAVLVSLVFGGRVDDIRVRRGTSRGQAVH